MKFKMLMTSYSLFLLMMVLGGGYLYQTEIRTPQQTRLEKQDLSMGDRFDVYSVQTSKKKPFHLEKDIQWSTLLSNRLLLAVENGKPIQTDSKVFLKLVSEKKKTIYIHKKKNLLTFSFEPKGQQYVADSKADARILASLQDYL